MTSADQAERRRAFHDDGAILVEGLLDERELAVARATFDWSLANPGPAASRPFEGVDGTFYQDLCHPVAPWDAHYQALLHGTGVAELVTGLWDDPTIWFMYEQVFLKEGGENRRTPWHQDAPYLSVEGDHLAVVWLSFDHVPKEDSLEFVRGSHRATLYNTSAFDPTDETVPIYEGLPRLPDIEAFPELTATNR